MRDVVVGANGETLFTIENTGTSDLTLTGENGPVVLSGDDKSQFTIVQPTSATLKPKEKTDFTVRFAPFTPGEKKRQSRLPARIMGTARWP